MYLGFLPSQQHGRFSDSLNWLELAWQYIVMARNNLCIVSISLSWYRPLLFNFFRLWLMAIIKDWWNTVVLGRMYRSILSSCWGIERQYWLTSGAKRRRRPVLPLNSEAWWQYWPIHPTQNYCIVIVSMPTFVPNIYFFSILVHVLYSIL